MLARIAGVVYAIASVGVLLSGEVIPGLLGAAYAAYLLIGDGRKFVIF